MCVSPQLRPSPLQPAPGLLTGSLWVAIGWSRAGANVRRLMTLDLIDKKTHEIRQDDDKTVYKSLEEIGDDLPDHSPRYILLSYPMTLVGAYNA